MTVVPISCQSEGALQVYIEPVLPAPHLVIVGRSPMAQTLAELARALGWRTDLVDPGRVHWRRCSTPTSGRWWWSRPRATATRRHDRARGGPAPGLPGPGRVPPAGPRPCSATWPSGGCRRTSSTGCTCRPGWTWAGPRTARSAVAILAELVQLRASGALRRRARPRRAGRAGRTEALDPVCGMTVQPRRVRLCRSSTTGSRTTSAAPAASRAFEENPDAYTQGGADVIITSDFEVAEPIDKVWKFFEDIPQVASCLPGAELTKDLGDDKYEGKVAIRMGPVRLQFAGTADITERDDAGQAPGRGRRGRGREGPRPGRHGGRRHAVAQGPRHQGRGRPGPAAVRGGGPVRPGHGLRRLRRCLMRDFATTMQDRIERLERGESAEQIAAAGAGGRSAGFAIGAAGRADGADARLRAASSVPYQPANATANDSERRTAMVLWWIGNAVLLVAVLPVVIYLLNRVLAAPGADPRGQRRHPGRRRRPDRRAGRGPRRPGRHRQDHRRSEGRRGPLRRLRRETTRLAEERTAMPAAAWMTIVGGR